MSIQIDHQFHTDQAGSVELARYKIPGATRILVAEAVEGRLQITDRPAGGEGESYLVDTGFESTEQLEAFVADYLDQAELLEACPMSREGISRMLDNGPTRAREAIS